MRRTFRRPLRPSIGLLCSFVTLALTANAAAAVDTRVDAAATPTGPSAPVAAGMRAAGASTVQSHTFRSTALQRDWSYVVYLPPGYRADGPPDGPRYPVLYLLHGNDDDAHRWITEGHLQTAADALIARTEIPPVVIVMPQGGTDWYVDRKEKIETAFFGELLPHVESHYAVTNDRKGRAIGGVSMGGFGALRYAMLEPDRFCGVLLLSPAIYSGEPPLQSAARRVHVFGEQRFDADVWHALNYPALWPRYMSQPYRLPMFIAAGDNDVVIEAEASLLYTHLREAGNPAALRIIGGGHNWDTWSALLPAALKYGLSCIRSS